MSYKPKAPPVVSDINVIPMADIMLVLLIIFMVVTPMLTKGMNVDLVPVQNPTDMPDADKEDAIVVAITRDGAIHLGQDQIPLDTLTSRVRDLVSNRIDKTVFIKSDARAKYGRVVQAVDEVRAAGVDRIGLLTERIGEGRKATPAAPAAAAAPTGGS